MLKQISDNSVQLLVAKVATNGSTKDAAASDNSSNNSSHLLIMQAPLEDKRRPSISEQRQCLTTAASVDATELPLSINDNDNDNKQHHCDVAGDRPNFSTAGFSANQNGRVSLCPAGGALTDASATKQASPGTMVGVKANRRRVSPTSSCSAPGPAACSQTLKQPTQDNTIGCCSATPQQSTGKQGEQQATLSQHQRQTELLQLMRLRQVQRQQQQQQSASNAINLAAAAGSHELPTLEQLQQRLRSVSQKSHGESPHHQKLGQQQQQQQQSERMLFADSVVAGLQQRPQQQQQQQQQQQGNQQQLNAMLDQRPRNQATQPEVEQPLDAGLQLHLHSQQQATLSETSPSGICESDAGQDNLLTTTRTNSPQTMTTSSNTLTPTASERLQRHSNPTSQLSILTSNLQHQTKPQHQTLRNDQSSLESPAQSTPANSVLSDSTTLITEAAINSAELIPKLIERLDRKLVVMKDEQLSLMREIELNECNGRRLFQSMERHLTTGELDKVSVHATEIEKVTKLILSLKLRLKRVQNELKERNQRRPPVVHQQSPQEPPHPSVVDSSHLSQETKQSQKPANSELQQQQQQHKQVASQTVVRGVSDPTSTGGLPKRNHQHHTSLQPAGSEPSAHLLDTGTEPKDTLLSPFKDSSVALREEEETDDVNKAASSASRDSIFNCDDSAIGSTITGHGGSATNIGNNHQQATTCSQSSLTSSHSSSFTASSTANHHHRLRFEGGGSPSQSNLSSSISVSSHSSSVSSVPNSPPLVSPVGQSVEPAEFITTRKQHHSSGSTGHVSSNGLTGSLFKPPPHDSNNNQTQATKATTDKPSSGQQEALHMLTDLDILAAKRDKLISQLEEAHQLEECIAHRNNVIIQRILSKYYQCHNEHSEPSEIEEFRQFTRLKSLLLKDMHDIADRIESAELQLTELKHTSQCST